MGGRGGRNGISGLCSVASRGTEPALAARLEPADWPALCTHLVEHTTAHDVTRPRKDLSFVGVDALNRQYGDVNNGFRRHLFRRRARLTKHRASSSQLVQPVQVKFACLLSWAIGLFLLLPTTTFAKDHFEQSRTIAGPPQSTTERFNFTLNQDDAYPHFKLAIACRRGARTCESSIRQDVCCRQLELGNVSLSFSRSPVPQPLAPTLLKLPRPRQSVGGICGFAEAQRRPSLSAGQLWLRRPA
jgi:hypothetical protein